jgi:hypothetical protein
MSDVTVPFGENAAETATLLLAAAEEAKDADASAVRTGSGVFIVPEEIAKSAGVDYESDDDEGEAEAEPAKKTAAKKASK